MGAQTILSHDIPQANAIERVHLLAQLLHSHEMERVADAFSDPRDKTFYFHAARLLGFIGDGDLLTPSERQLATTEGTEAFRALAAGFVQSVVGSAWMKWADVDDVRHLNPLEAKSFLSANCKFSKETQKRRASTLAAWVHGLCAGLPALAVGARPTTGGRAPQLAFTDMPGTEGFADRVAWPSPTRFLHNEDGARVGEVLATDLSGSKDVLIVSGYSGLDSLIRFLGDRKDEDGSKVRLLLGTEPFPAKASRFRARGDVGAELRDYWLERGISVLLSGALLHVRVLVNSGAVEARTACSNRPVHAKMYVSASAVTLGSSNFTTAGLGRQSEANVRFPVAEKRRFDEAQSLAEGLWSKGADYSQEFLRLLDALLRSVSWQEALARACASILEGESFVSGCASRQTSDGCRFRIRGRLPTPGCACCARGSGAPWRTVETEDVRGVWTICCLISSRILFRWR